jgi:hypothetical protein
MPGFEITHDPDRDVVGRRAAGLELQLGFVGI